MRRFALFAFLVLVGSALPCVPAAEAKDKVGEQSSAERDFVALWGSDDAKKRASAIDGLRNAPDPLRFQLLTTLVFPKEKRADVLARAVEVLGRVKDEQVCASLVSLAKTSGPEIRVLYVECMAAMQNSPAAHRAVLEFSKDKDSWVRAMAIYAVGEHRTPDGLDTLLAALEDRQWQVQAAAVGALPYISDKDLLRSRAVPKLVEYLDGSSGRLRDDCLRSLRKITGKDLGKEPDAWKKWLAGGDAAVPPKAPVAEGPKEPADAYGNQPPSKPHFYGMEVTSNRFVIVFDRSLSMIDPIDIDKDRLRRETSQRKAITGEGAPKPGEKADADDLGYDIPWWRVKTKMDLARYQAINLIAGLDPGQSFEIILFSTDVEPWMGRLVPANQANKQKAIAMLEALKGDGETNTWGAISSAFEMSASNARTGGAGQPDEIWFVTDGQPSKGDIQDGEQIHDAVIQLSKVHQMRVNVIGIGVNLSFLRKMAVSTGGQFRFFL